MSDIVLDASSVLALLNQETGHTVVASIMKVAAMSTVNLAEVVARLADKGMTASDIHEALDNLGFEPVPFDSDLAYATGLLRPTTRAFGLSLGDRACLALAQRLRVPVLTSDQAWRDLRIGVEIRVLR